MARLAARSLSGLPEIAAGEDLAELIVQALEREQANLPTEQAHSLSEQAPSPSERTSLLSDGQIVAIAHKAVSKAERAVVDLRKVIPTEQALELAATLERTSPAATPAGEEQAPPGRDPRLVQVVLDQSSEIVRAAGGVLIARTHHGFVCANAGVDGSNSVDPQIAITLPHDPDRSARAIRSRLRELTGASVAVIVSDSFGRAWRHGQCDVAIGAAGIEPLDDWRGRTDSSGMQLRATWLAVADAIAALADLARAKDSREPVVIVEGLERFVTDTDGPGAAALLRALDQDLFR